MMKNVHTIINKVSILLLMVIAVLICTATITACAGHDDEIIKKKETPNVVDGDDDGDGNGNGKDDGGKDDDGGNGDGNGDGGDGNGNGDGGNGDGNGDGGDGNGDGDGDGGDGNGDGGDGNGGDDGGNIKAYITDTLVYTRYPSLTNYNFVYPSTDPFGNEVMLSGTITVNRRVLSDKRGDGLMLYNHYTVFKDEDCPSKGYLDIPGLLNTTLMSNRLIIISPDYYGFGETADKMQAYCIPTANAHASVDALIAARQLLKKGGFEWDEDELLNVGYSQGGQTAIAVLRLIDEQYPDIHITRTLAGGGPYDMGETYRQFLKGDKTGMPSTIISVLLAYNEYFRLGLPLSSMFVEPTLSHIDDWLLSKKLNVLQIDTKVGSKGLESYIAPDLFDLDSEVSRKVMNALNSESLCQGWRLRQGENVLLVHHTKDAIVPIENTENLYKFLQAQGTGNVELQTVNFLSLGVGQINHVTGAAAFLTYINRWIRQHYGY